MPKAPASSEKARAIILAIELRERLEKPGARLIPTRGRDGQGEYIVEADGSRWKAHFKAVAILLHAGLLNGEVGGVLTLDHDQLKSLREEHEMPG